MTNNKYYPPVGARELSTSYQVGGKYQARGEWRALFNLKRRKAKQLPLPFREEGIEHH